MPVGGVIADLAQATALLLSDAELAVADGVVTEAQFSAWRADLELRAAQGRFFIAFAAFVVAGRTP